MDINERAERLVNAMLQGQNDFISASNKQQEELSEAKNSNMKELLEIYDKGYNDAVNKACAWLFKNFYHEETMVDCIAYKHEDEDINVMIEQFKQAMER